MGNCALNMKVHISREDIGQHMCATSSAKLFYMLFSQTAPLPVRCYGGCQGGELGAVDGLLLIFFVQSLFHKWSLISSQGGSNHLFSQKASIHLTWNYLSHRAQEKVFCMKAFITSSWFRFWTSTPTYITRHPYLCPYNSNKHHLG